MTVIPLDLERTFERRWAARFFSPVVSAPSQRHWPESGNRLPSPAKAKQKQSPRPDSPFPTLGSPLVSPGFGRL
jgi:hypothetical protein